ncbi:hypothetical protein GMLC_30870 [Geomonas limicola]|uniref:Uncharacterized protein n=1 Tax=Geomonas limicola TaxID=2740186 RepID=A0A6V8NA89_9BACT|nr:hypothetical protein [Geomonas limicola]GFO69508.1 hypothetical protein GMLC_30870 [Geomonas limicola]
MCLPQPQFAPGTTWISATQGSRIMKITLMPVRTLVNLITATLMALGLSLLPGCGGTGSPSAADTVSGLAATGQPVQGSVFLKDAAGREASTTTADGSFRFDISHLTPPFLLKATWNGGQLYSMARGAGTANITPLTQVIVQSANAGGDLDALYQAPTPTALAALADALPAASAALMTALKPILENYQAYQDPIATPFRADGNGMDGVLDHLTVTSSAGSVQISERGTGAALLNAPLSDISSGSSSTLWDAARGAKAQGLQLGVSADGHPLAVWVEDTGQGGTSLVKAQWLEGGTPVTVSTGQGQATNPQVARDAAGNAYLAWCEYTGGANDIWTSRYHPGSGWGTPARLTSTDSNSYTGSPSIASDANGNLLLAWTQFNRNVNSNHFDIYLSSLSGGTGSWSAPARVSNGVNSAYQAIVVQSGVGSACLAWIQALDDGSTSNGASEVYAATLQEGTPGTPVKLNALPGSSRIVYGQLQLAMNQAGVVMAAWVQANQLGFFDVWCARRTAGGAWEDAVSVSEGNLGECYQPSLALNGSGAALLAWMQQNDAQQLAGGDPTQRIVTSNYLPGSGWGAPQAVSPAAYFAFAPQLALDATGNATAVWYQIEAGQAMVRSARLVAGGSWGTPVLEAATTTDGYQVYPVPRVTCVPAGRTFIAWGTDSN